MQRRNASEVNKKGKFIKYFYVTRGEISREKQLSDLSMQHIYQIPRKNKGNFHNSKEFRRFYDT